MKKILKIIGWILLILVTIAAVAWFAFLKPEPPPISPEDRAEISLMPLPADLKLGKGVLVLDANLGYEFTGLSTPRMERAMGRFYKKLNTHTGIHFGTGNTKTLLLDCSGIASAYPSLGDDESYSIKISEQKVLVKAATETGIMYALESLLQLAVKKEGQWVLPVLHMKDQPRYPWRGVMIDACRHWIPKDVILRNLDAMATVKMNVFHWHLTEYQGFRIESKLFPKLHEMGSNGDFYTQDELREVVEYAADRGIRVIPEFDLPGHTTSWFVGYPELASAPGPYTLDTIFGILDPVLDPTSEEVYEFLDQFFGEMTGLFPDESIHIGGDEVNAKQWNENPDIQEFMSANALEDSHALQAHFNLRLQKLLATHGKKMMGWDEILHPDLSEKGIIVQTWRDHASLWESAHQGNMAVLSAGYYLDHKQPASYHYNVDPTIIPGAVDIEIDSNNWKGWDCELNMAEMSLDGSLFLFGEGDEMRGIMEFMGSSTGFTEVSTERNRIFFVIETSMGEQKFETEMHGDSISGSAKFSVFNLRLNGHRSGGSDMPEGRPLPEFKKIEPLGPEEESNLLGGEACMWSEMVDERTMESRIWPRAAAVGEKLWSPKVLTDDTGDMYRRIMILDDLLENLGLRHRNYNEVILREIATDPFLEPLRTLVGVLQEDKMFNRMVIYDPPLNTSTPLNRVVDTALPESYVVYSFGQDVDLWLESADEMAKGRITSQLESWAANHDLLVAAFEESERLQEVESHSLHLSSLASLGLEVLTDPALMKGRASEIEALFASAGESYGGCILPLVEHFKKLVESATKN